MYNHDMKTKQKVTAGSIGDLAELSLDQVIAEWRRQRYNLFLALKMGRKTNEWIGKRYGISRQAVGQFMKSMRDEKK